MATRKLPSLSPQAGRGSDNERRTFTKMVRHYQMGRDDLDTRISDFDTKDELFRSFIDESTWPYNSVVFDPRVFTALFEKTARLFAKKPRGRMVPREGGDALGAMVNNELLSFQWDENERANNQTMLSKWATMDQNCRKYGASFALCKWRFEKKLEKDGKDKKGKDKFKSVPFFDGPDFTPLVNRDVLLNPSYSTIRLWFQHRDYLTLDELKNTNDAARTKPIYKNLDILQLALREEIESKSNVADKRQTNWESRNKTVKGLLDWLGKDEYNLTVEVVTEYSNNRWVTFAPKHGIILRDIPNPYDHQQIPVVMLKYYPVDDDIYGLSEIEPVEKLQKAINALINQYLDSVNMSLYVPLKIRAAGVQMHTIEFGPGAKWIMNDPQTDIIPHESSGKGINEFASTYRFMVGAMQEALGETSASTSNLDPGAPEKTATEIKDLSVSRNARDNFNQLYLSESIKKQMMFWHVLNRQFLFSDPNEQAKVIRIVGKDAIRYFQERGLDGVDIDEEGAAAAVSDAGVAAGINPQELATPQFPIDVGGEQLPKFTLEQGDQIGHLIITPEDLSGNYDYIADIESMQIPDEGQLLQTKRQMIEFAKDPATVQLLAQEGKRMKLSLLMEDFFEQLGLKDATKYFERIPDVEQTGEGAAQGSNAGAGNGFNARVGGTPKAPAGGQAKPSVSRPS